MAQRFLLILLKSLAPLVVLTTVSGCASQSELTAIRLDADHPKYQSTSCQNALAGSDFHRDAKTLSLIASPALVVLSGGLLLPVVAANAGLDVADRIDASNMATRCGAKGQSANEIAGSVVGGAALGVVSGVAPK